MDARKAALASSLILSLAVSAYAQPARIERNVARSKATLAEALAEPAWRDGEIVATQGYNTANDGGGNQYRYRRTGRSLMTIDGGFFIAGSGADDYFEAIDKSEANPMQFGAIGNGSTDDSAKIQAAIDSDVTVRFPSGKSFAVASTLNLDNAGQKILGRGATIELAATNLDQIFYVTAERVLIEGIEIDGNADTIGIPTGRSDAIGIYATDCIVRDCYIHDFRTKHGMSLIYVGTVNYVLIEGNRLENSGYCCIRPDAYRSDIVNNVMWYSTFRTGYQSRTLNANRAGTSIRWIGGIVGADADYTDEISFLVDIQAESATRWPARTVVIDGVTFDAPGVVPDTANQLGKLEGVTNIVIKNVSSNVPQGLFLRISLVVDDKTNSVAFDNTTDTVTSNDHGLRNGQAIYFTTTGSLPSGLSASTYYYVMNATTDTFQLGLERYEQGGPIDFTTDGSGTHTLFKVPQHERVLIENCRYYGAITAGSAIQNYQSFTIRDCDIRARGIFQDLDGVENILIQNVRMESTGNAGLINGESMDIKGTLTLENLHWINMDTSGYQYLLTNSALTNLDHGKVIVKNLKISEADEGQTYLSNSNFGRLFFTWDGEAYHYNPPKSSIYMEPVGSHIGSAAGGATHIGTRTGPAATNTSQYTAYYYGSSQYDPTDAFRVLSDSLSTDLLQGAIVKNHDQENNGLPAYWIFSGTRWIPGNSAGFAQISIEDNATATTVASTQSDWSAKSQFVGFGSNFASSRYATADHTNDHITLTYPGVYEVQAVLTLSGSVVSDLWELALWKNNGATQVSTKQGVNIRGAGLTYEKQVTISGLVDASANDTIELWVQRTNGTGSITITNAVMTAKKVSD